MRRARPRTRREQRLLEVLDLDLRRRGATHATRHTAARSVILFLRAVRRTPEKITRRSVERFLADRARAGLSPATRYADLVRLRMLFRALAATGVMTHDPTDGLAVPDPARRAVLVLSEPEVQRLMAVAAERNTRQPRLLAFALRDRACLELLYLGLRQSEVAAAKVTDLDLGQGQVLVRSAKRGRSRILPVPPKALVWIERWLREGRPTLLRQPDGGALLLGQFGRALDPTRGVHLIVQRVGRRAGVVAHPHAFRRAVASHFVRAGASVLVVQAMLGHKQLGTTAAYVEIEREELRRAVEGLNSSLKRPSEISSSGCLQLA